MSNTIKVLRNSSEIREAIWQLFSAPNARRIALVAYVGANAQEYLPYPEGIELICWDKEGSTDPDTIRILRNLKVKVSFANKLHMKVFWAEKRGVIIGSANLSSNGLGDNGLREAAVLLPASSINIDKLKAAVDAKPVTPTRLRELDTRTLRYRSRNAGKDVYPPIKRELKRRQPPITFADWYKSEDRKFWRIFIYDEYIHGLTAEAEQQLHAMGYKSCEDYWRGAKCHAIPHKWLLAVDTNKKRGGVYWSCADFTVPVKRSDKQFYDKREPFFSVQIRPTSKYRRPPFELDKVFIKAIRWLLMENEVKTYMDGLEFAPSGLIRRQALKRLYEYYCEEKCDE